MSNICITDYTFVGDADDLRALYVFMQGQGDNSFHTLLKALGENPEEICCRGEWYDLSIAMKTVTFRTESAWKPLYQAIELLCRHFRALTYYYYAMEPGTGLYITNDKSGFYYPSRVSDDGQPIELVNVLSSLTPYHDGDGKLRLVAFDGSELGTVSFEINGKES